MNNHSMFGFFNVDLVIIFIVYLYVFFGLTSAGIFALGQGLLIDIFSGGVMGLFALVYVLFFIIVKIGSYPFHLYSSGGQIIFLSLASIFKGFLILVCMFLFSFEVTFSSNTFYMLLSSSIFTGLITPILFFIPNRISGLIDVFSEET